MAVLAPSLPRQARLLNGSPGIQVSLSHYAAGERHHRHAHDHVQVSFLITGSVQETIGRRGFEMTTSSACIKPVGADHEDLWGKCGALMLTVRLARTDLLETTGMEPAKWWLGRSPSPLLVRSALTTVGKCDVDGLAADLIAELDVSDTPPERSVPTWLGRVVEALWDGEQLTSAEAAQIAGVHRVHLSRAFIRHLGTPFSAYRRRVAASRAIDQALRTNDRLADIAADAGFADQAHMHRTLVAIAGTSPRRLREQLTPSASLSRGRNGHRPT